MLLFVVVIENHRDEIIAAGQQMHELLLIL